MEFNRGIFSNFQHAIYNTFFVRRFCEQIHWCHISQKIICAFYIHVLFLTVVIKKGYIFFSYAFIDVKMQFINTQKMCEKESCIWQDVPTRACSCIDVCLAHVPLVIHYKVHIFSAELLYRQSFLLPCHAIDYSWLYMCAPPCWTILLFLFWSCLPICQYGIEF